MTEEPNLLNLHYDPYQFYSREQAISAASRIDFRDFGKMHVESRVAGERRLPTPIWSARLDWLGELCLVYTENRLYFLPPATVGAAHRGARHGRYCSRFAAISR